MDAELHPDARSLLDALEDAPPMHELTAAEMRVGQRRRSTSSGDPEPVGAVEDVVVRGHGHGIPVRVYRPEGDGPFPVLVWAHGGGFVMGDVDTEDDTARALANAAECVVASVDYRIAPEHPFPAPQRDVYAVTEWAAERADVHGGDPDRLAVGGQSAGANLAAATTLLARERGGPDVGYQVLVVPAVNYSREFPSHREFDGIGSSREGRERMDELYLGDPIHGHNPYAYPLEASDFGGLPPATVITAGVDPLRDEGEAYAEALAAAGTEVTHRRYDDVIHLFLAQFGDREWERAREAADAIGEDLQAHFS